MFNRLRAMSLPEILFRVKRSVVQRIEARKVASGWIPLPANPVTSRCVLFDGDSQLIDKWKSSFALDIPALEAYRTGNIDFFGNEPLDIGNPVNWNRDPVTGIEAPVTYGKSIDYRDDRLVGNIKFTWELGRHQHLVPIAVAYAVTGDEQYRTVVIHQIDGWIEQNPFAMGIHWCSALEVALRLLSWSVIHSLLALRDGDSGLFAHVQEPKRLGEAIFQHAYFVRHFLSRYSSANNHLIGELTGLYTGCSVFDLGDEGSEWAVYAHVELEHESMLQVHADGVNKEQAFYYHLWVLDYLLFAWLVGIRSGQPFSDAFSSRIVAMTGFLQDICPEGGEPPQVGDADDGVVTRFEVSWPNQPYADIQDAMNSIFGNKTVPVGQKAFWYHSIHAQAGSDRKQPELAWARQYPVIYPDGGYAILGAHGCHIVFDAGPLGYLGIAAHGHADALSFCVAIDGIWWLVDPGTYAYHSDSGWRDYFRGTYAHNTIVVNGDNQSKITGAFMWSNKARARIGPLHESGNVQTVEGEHDGYRTCGVSHNRKISYNHHDGEIEVIDHLAGGNAVDIEILFHFAPEITVQKDENTGQWVGTHPCSNRRMLIELDDHWEASVKNGSETPILGWYSPALEVKLPADTLHGRTTYTGELTAVTRILIE